jgi:aspartokinase
VAPFDNNFINKYNLVMNDKQLQRALLKKIRKNCRLSNTELAIMANTSSSLVSYVWSGLQKNPKILNLIFDNLEEGWDNDLTPAEIGQIENLCQLQNI